MAEPSYLVASTHSLNIQITAVGNFTESFGVNPPGYIETKPHPSSGHLSSFKTQGERDVRGRSSWLDLFLRKRNHSKLLRVVPGSLANTIQRSSDRPETPLPT